MSLIMISCRRASELMSQQLDRPLKLGEKLKLQAHLMICKSCPKTHQQFEILHQAGRRYASHSASHDIERLKLADEAKQRILKTIEAQTGSGDADKQH